MLSTTGTVPVELRETEQFASLKIEPNRNIWHFDKTLHRSCRTRYNISFNINAPININPAGGGGGCGAKVGDFTKKLKFWVKFPRLGRLISIKSIKKSPPGDRISLLHTEKQLIQYYCPDNYLLNLMLHCLSYDLQIPFGGDKRSSQIPSLCPHQYCIYYY